MKTATITNLLAGWPTEPFVFKHRSYDIPETTARMIATLPSNCVAVGIGWQGGYDMCRRAERAARKRGMRILWRRYGLPR